MEGHQELELLVKVEEDHGEELMEEVEEMQIAKQVEVEEGGETPLGRLKTRRHVEQ